VRLLNAKNTASETADNYAIVNGITVVPKNAIIPDVKVAGKTGTAQKAVPGQGYVDGKYTSLFGCFLPADAPELVFVVVLDEAMPYGGGATAAPVFHDVMLEWMNTGHFVPPSKR